MKQELYIPDPYLFIYPEPELNTKTVARFIQNLSEWAKVFDQPHISIGLSPACIEVLKQHSRSILNGKFLGQIIDELNQSHKDGIGVVVNLITRLKKSIEFSNVLKHIDRKDVDYELHEIRISPEEFCKRLPEGVCDRFLQMLGELAFAFKQGFDPITAYNTPIFPTRYTKDEKWLITWVDMTYVVGESIKEARSLKTNPLEGRHLRILRQPPASESETQPVFTISSFVEEISRLYPEDIVISDQLCEILKDTHILHNEKLRRALEALVQAYLPAYREAVNGIGNMNPALTAKGAFNQCNACEISGESETVRKSEKLSAMRTISLKGQYLGAAYNHVKVDYRLRLHFSVCLIAGQYRLVLGYIGNHLPIATQQH